MRILVLGAYGLIGQEIARALGAAGYRVIGLGRSLRTGRRLLPTIGWVAADIGTLHSSEDWRKILDGIDVVVNASGALQRGARDNLRAVQEQAIIALIMACEEAGVGRFVQISAPGATEEASTEFLRSKARADARLKRSDMAWAILRPGLVIGATAYGGTALIRMLAGFPLIQPLVLGDKRIQTVALTDVADIVVRAVAGELPPGSDLDLVEAKPHALKDIVALFQQWLGAPPAWLRIALPLRLGYCIARVADGLGHLGWRSPLRTTALRVLEDEILGDPAQLRAILGRDLTNLDRILDAMPATLQERWFARLYLMLPVMIGTLAFFWLFSGLVALVDLNRTLATIPTGVLRPNVALAVVVGGSVADIALGLGILFRRTAKLACLGMAVLTVFYLLAGTVLTPDLWADPLGPFVKTLPAMVLALVTALVLEER